MKTWINHGEPYYGFDVKAIEEKKNAKFVCELAILTRNGGWSETPVQIYWQETPPVQGYSNYFGLFTRDGSAFITSGETAFGIPIEGIETPAGEIIYSRYRHDFRSAKTADYFVDGGLDYFRGGGADIHVCKHVTLTIKGSELVVVEDAEEIKALYERKDKITGRTVPRY